MRGAKEFLSQSIDNAKTITDKDTLLRMDAGYDSKDILEICQGKKVNFIIKCNLRNNVKDKIIEKCHNNGEMTIPREGQKVYRGSYQKNIPGLKNPVKVVFDLKETTIDELKFDTGGAKLKIKYLKITRIIINIFWTVFYLM